MAFSDFVEKEIKTPICCELKRYLDKLYEPYEMEELDMKLTKEEFKASNNNIMTVMENRIMMLAHCDRTTANLIANEVLDLERELKTLKDDSVSKEAFEKMKTKSYQYGYRKGYAKAIDDVLKLQKYTFYDTSKEFMNIRIDAISIEDILKLKEKTNEQRKQSKPNRND